METRWSTRYVINRSEGTDQWHNGGGTDFGTYKSTTDFNGYFNTDKLQAISAGYNDMMTYVRKQTNSPQTTSGWFLPSIGQLIYIKKKYAEVISKSFDKCGGAMGRGWQHHYWSSTEADAANHITLIGTQEHTVKKQKLRIYGTYRLSI